MVKSVLNSENCTRSWQGAPRLEILWDWTSKTWGNRSPQASSPPQRGECALLQDGLEHCWLQDFPGSQPFNGEGRMGGGPVTRESSLTVTDGVKLRSPGTIPITLELCTPQLLLLLVPSPFLTANLCSGLIFAYLFSHPSLCSLTWQALLLAGY